ncbi:uncharacterized protein EV154DRAFT_598927 [Mucor mucedo]|uniref:uncharacterized protein n=1 Tax=Mucor mucedo TaxID=29922 RepID=UPI0022203A69|nr:uncharacterized protein EV154DRAFT_598927 [Mucor mucedo]KAI7895630.1 hypothetical protein EV154DRAFT_598927 [Mucor mucedo]
MDSIQSSSDVPNCAGIEAHPAYGLLTSLKSPETEPQHISFSITASGSSVIHAFNDFGTGESGHTLDLVDSYDEESDEEYKIPSDLSIHHHPYRTCEYTLTFNKSDEDKEKEEEEEEEEEDDATELEDTLESESEWMLGNVSISNLCLDFKKANLKLATRTDPAQLSDIRLLALNDIYIFDRNSTLSVSKYFPSKVHTMLTPTLSFDAYFLAEGLDCYNWCMDIEISRPADWFSSLSLCAKFVVFGTSPTTVKLSRGKFTI